MKSLIGEGVTLAVGAGARNLVFPSGSVWSLGRSSEQGLADSSSIPAPPDYLPSSLFPAPSPLTGAPLVAA
ncbi:unnamed protein product [Lota lota]